LRAPDRSPRITETPAPLGFVARTFPEAKLLPLDDAFALARAGVDLGRLPRVLEHRQRMARDPVVVRCLAAELAA
jgi:hypothetical protein